MSLKTKEKTIDGLSFHVTQLPARRSLQLQLRLSRKLLPVLGGLISSKTGLDTEINLESLSTSIDKLITSLDESEFFKLAMEIYSHTKVEGKEVNETNFDLIFNSNLQAFYKGIKFVLEVEYGSFFEEGGIFQSLNKFQSSK